LRIIGGQLRGRKLQTFKGLDVRPTADRVREALFNILGSKPVNASVLDLFSGTGALGIEALSRGASMAVFVDSSVHALAVLRKNIEHCALKHCAQAIQWDIVKNLDCLKRYPKTFDLVLMDPPYNYGLLPLAIKHLLQSHSLSPEALLVAEHGAHTPPEITSSQLTCIDSRRYGRTGLSFISFRP
jgi:16S rRNA (guanine966-N2)-methyltransferase